MADVAEWTPGGDGGSEDLRGPAAVRRAGHIIAVTGVGAGDMVSLSWPARTYGTVLIWAILVGALLKFFLTEGIGRWYMASGQTMLQGLALPRALERPTTS